MNNTKKVMYKVRCVRDQSHVIDVVLEVFDGVSAVDQNLDVYCYQCDRMVRFEIDEKVVPDTSRDREIT